MNTVDEREHTVPSTKTTSLEGTRYDTADRWVASRETACPSGTVARAILPSVARVDLKGRSASAASRRAQHRSRSRWNTQCAPLSLPKHSRCFSSPFLPALSTTGVTTADAACFHAKLLSLSEPEGCFSKDVNSNRGGISWRLPFFFLFWSLFTGVARSNFCASIYGWVGGSVWKISRIDRYGNRRFERIFSWNDRAIGIRSIKMFLIAVGEGGLVLTFSIRGKSLRKFAAFDGSIWT